MKISRLVTVRCACLIVLICSACTGPVTRDIAQKEPIAIELTTTIKAELLGSPKVDAASVRVSLVNEKIIVSGFVSSDAEANEVMRLNRLHSQGHEVINMLTVKPVTFD